MNQAGDKMVAVDNSETGDSTGNSDDMETS